MGQLRASFDQLQPVIANNIGRLIKAFAGAAP